MTGKNFDKWLKDAGVIDGKNITTTITGIAFSKVAGLVRVIQSKLYACLGQRKRPISAKQNKYWQMLPTIGRKLANEMLR
jgi:hypothetical protein